MMRRAALLLFAVGGAVGLIALFRPRPPAAPPETPGPRLAWTFEAPHAGTVIAAPLVTDTAVYLAATHVQGFTRSGALYALDPATGKPKWTFDADGGMLPTASTPALAGGRLFLGEGMHANFSCRLFCLDPATGRQHWTFQTGDHIEGGPAVVGDTVYFAAGNDGVYAVGTATGARRWNFRADLHIDSSPVVVDGRVYVGSGPSRKHSRTQVVCLDAATGNPVWRAPAPGPAWAAPVVALGRVFAGLGNGRLTEPAQSPEVPAGALAAFDVASGAPRWVFPVGDAVFGRPAVVAERVVFGSRDGNLYGVSVDGHEVFRVAMGGPVIAPPVVDRGRVVAVSVAGRVVWADPADGREVWRHDLPHALTSPHVYAAPCVAGGRLYIASEMRTTGSSAGIVTLSCFDLPPDANAGSDPLPR